MSRLHKTLADYAVIAVSPALIMILVGSLVFFLIQAFYDGGYEARVRWIFGCYVFATVLVSRIAIDEGREHAVFFAIPLALAMLLALSKFVQAGLLINLGLMALIWWCADKLIWDCTVFDEAADASGKGLLQTVGWHRTRPHRPPNDATLPTSQGGQQPSAPPVDQDPEATSSREPPTPATLWARFLAQRRRAHAPGVWVVYISLLALPLFGIGQRFIPASDLAGRRSAFWLLCYFAASALGLLLTSSFLNLRRYLRQRRLEMPVEMAGVWLGTGGILILVVLVLCMALPRPHPEYTITQTDWRIGSPDGLQASRHGTGGDGAPDPQARAQTATVKDQPGPGGAPGEQARQQGGQGSGEAPGTGNAKGRGQSDANGSGKTSNQPGSPGSEGDGQREQGADAQLQSPDPDGQPADDDRGGPPSDQPSPKPSAGDASGDRPGSKGEPSPQAKSSSERGGSPSEGQAASKPTGGGSGAQTQQESSPPGETPPAETDETPPSSSRGPLPQPTEMLNRALGSIPYLLKGLYYLAFLVLVGYLAWRYRSEIATALRDFLQAIRDFWAGLSGGRVTPRDTAEAEPLLAPVPPRPFAAFPDPFSSGEARRLSPRELVVYSFHALEAWGREHDCPRAEDQTPHEFASRLVAAAADVGREARSLADLYCTAAYSPQRLGSASVAQLERLWQSLRAN